MAEYKRQAVIGAGAWGTALAQVLARNGREVLLWAHEEPVAEEINTKHANSVYLPGIALEPSIKAHSNLAACADADLILAVAPSQHMRRVMLDLAPHLSAGIPVLICSKGIELGSLSFMSNVVAECLPEAQIGVLSGPSFASEVACGLPTAVTLACENEKLGQELAEAVGAPTFRPYWHDDVIGAQVGGAVKNVLAIACGVVTGKKLGDSARAALITRGFAEVRRLGVALGARPETLAGLSGLGDLVLTCNSHTSRNMSLGFALGEGKPLDDILGSRRSVAEGVETSFALRALAGKLGVEMPISESVAQILRGEAPIDTAIEALLARPFKAER